MLTPIQAQELTVGDRFMLEQRAEATIFAVIVIHTFYVDLEHRVTEIDVENLMEIIIPATNIVYRVSDEPTREDDTDWRYHYPYEGK